MHLNHSIIHTQSLVAKLDKGLFKDSISGHAHAITFTLLFMGLYITRSLDSIIHMYNLPEVINNILGLPKVNLIQCLTHLVLHLLQKGTALSTHTIDSYCSQWRQLVCMVVSSLLVCSPPCCKRKQNDASTIDSKGTAIATQAQNHESSPRSTGMAGNQRLTTTSQGQKLRWCYSTLCPISELHDPVDSQSQLESISPPVGRPTTCVVSLVVW